MVCKSRKALSIQIMSNSTHTDRIKTDGFRLKIVNDLAEIGHIAAGEIERMADRTAREGNPFTIALSGGSTPRGLHALLAGDPAIRNQLPWHHLHFFWGDERHVPPDHPSPG